MDENILFNQMGERLGFIPETIVQMAFVDAWSRLFPTEAAGIIDAIYVVVSEDQPRA